MEQWSNITLFPLKTCRDCINSVQKSCQVFSLDMHLTRKESGKETCWSQTLRNWNRWTHLKSTQKASMQKEVLTPTSGEKFIFPIPDGTVRLSGADQVLRISTLIRDRPDRGKEQGNLRGESDGSSSTPLRDSSWFDGEARNDFWSISGNLIYRHHVEPRVELYVPREESFPIPLNDVTRTTDACLDMLLEKNVKDHWNVDGDRELSDTWSGERLTRRRPTSRPDTLWPEISFIVIALYSESNCTCRKKNHFPIPSKYIDVTRTTCTSLDVLLEKDIEDYWNVDGEKELSHAWTGFTNIHFPERKAT